MTNPPLDALRHHVSGAIDRGEATPIVAIPARQPVKLTAGERAEAAACDEGVQP